MTTNLYWQNPAHIKIHNHNVFAFFSHLNESWPWYERISVGTKVYGKAVGKHLLSTQSARILLILNKDVLCSLLTTLKEVVSVRSSSFWIVLSSYFNHDPAYLGRDGFYPATWLYGYSECEVW